MDVLSLKLLGNHNYFVGAAHAATEHSSELELSPNPAVCQKEMLPRPQFEFD